jgi:hypothetical protein
MSGVASVLREVAEQSLVHAKDAAAQAFYRKFAFESSPIDEFHLLMKDIQAALAGTP